MRPRHRRSRDTRRHRRHGSKNLRAIMRRESMWRVPRGHSRAIHNSELAALCSTYFTQLGIRCVWIDTYSKRYIRRARHTHSRRYCSQRCVLLPMAAVRWLHNSYERQEGLRSSARATCENSVHVWSYCIRMQNKRDGDMLFFFPVHADACTYLSIRILISYIREISYSDISSEQKELYVIMLLMLLVLSQWEKKMKIQLYRQITPCYLFLHS